MGQRASRSSGRLGACKRYAVVATAAALVAVQLAGSGSANAGILDTDGDGVPDAIDNCLLDSNKRQLDLDLDGLGNSCDSDLDGDVVSNLLDNCPQADNAFQKDDDGDGIGNVCDTAAALLLATGEIPVNGLALHPFGGAGMTNIAGVRTFQVSIQRINLQTKKRMHIGFVEAQGQRRYRPITKARLNGWPAGLTKSVVTGPSSLSRKDVIVVTVGKPAGKLRSAKNGYFKNSIMAGALKH